MGKATPISEAAITLEKFAALAVSGKQSATRETLNAQSVQ